MNERILKLADQAGWDISEIMKIQNAAKMQKFAELIVQECMNLVDNIDPKEAIRGLEDCPTYTIVATAFDNYLESVRQHFGVE